MTIKIILKNLFQNKYSLIEKLGTYRIEMLTCVCVYINCNKYISYFQISTKIIKYNIFNKIHNTDKKYKYDFK